MSLLQIKSTVKTEWQADEKNTTKWMSKWKEQRFRSKVNSTAKKCRSTFAVRPLHVLFVHSIHGYPYSPIADAIETSLLPMVNQLSVVHGSHPFALDAQRDRPDLVLVLETTLYSDQLLQQLHGVRQLNIPLAIWLPDDPYLLRSTQTLASYFDYVFTIDRSCVEMYRKLGCSSYYLPFGVCPLFFYPLNYPSPVRRSANIIATLTPYRLKFLDPILSQLLQKGLHITGGGWKQSAHFEQYGHQFGPDWLSPQETNIMYTGSKIVINLHQSIEDHRYTCPIDDVADAVSPNVRTFEVCAAGAFQLTDIREDLHHYYTPGVEIETYESRTELLDKVDYYLHHEKARQNIAIRGLKRTLNQHTYAHRLDKMFQIIFPTLTRFQK